MGKARRTDHARDCSHRENVRDLQGIAGKSLEEIKGLELKGVDLDEEE
jgi:hypothetical protein